MTSPIFRATCRDALKKIPAWSAPVPPEPWEKDSVVPADPVGSGQQAMHYLAPDIFRVALRNHRLLHLEDGHATFQDQEATTDTLTTQIRPVDALIRHFWPHVLPTRFINVRSSGFLPSRNRARLAQVNERLIVEPVDKQRPPHAPAAMPDGQQAHAMRCPLCGNVIRLVGDIAPRRLRPLWKTPRVGVPSHRECNGRQC
jgi:hypothetical protein